MRKTGETKKKKKGKMESVENNVAIQNSDDEGKTPRIINENADSSGMGDGSFTTNTPKDLRQTKTDATDKTSCERGEEEALHDLPLRTKEDTLDRMSLIRSRTLPSLHQDSLTFELRKVKSEPALIDPTSDSEKKQSLDDVLSEHLNLSETDSVKKKECETISELGILAKDKRKRSVYFRREMGTVVLEVMKNKEAVINGDNEAIELLSRHLPECFSPSIMPGKSDIVTVKFAIEGTQHIFTKAFNIFSTVGMLRENLSVMLDIDSDDIMLNKEQQLDDAMTLLEVGAMPFKTLELTIAIPDEIREMKLQEVKTNYVPLVDIITVKFVDEFGREVERTVEIENQSTEKPWLGGFKHTKTKKCYHHAQTQTKCLLKLKQEYAELTGTELTQRFSRSTQTPSFPLKNQGVNTVTNSSNQTYVQGVLIVGPDDKLIEPKRFKTYEEWFEENSVLEKVIRIQRYFRQWEAKRKVRRLMRTYNILNLEELRARRSKETEETQRSESPRSTKKYNFQIIVSMIEEWWKKEKQRIAETKTDAPRKAEMYQLLKKEINLLTALHKKHNEVQKETIDSTDVTILERVAEPKRFKSTIGEMVSIDSIETQKAREFVQVYKRLIQKTETARDRIEILLKAKNALVNSDEYKFSTQLLKLIDRELSLLRMGTDFSNITELQKRIHQLFLDYIRRPEFNPAITINNSSDPYDTSGILFTCKRCLKSLPLYEFSADSRKKKLNICNTCLKIENIAITRIDFSPYERMLKLIRDDEIKCKCYSSTCFILQPYGIYFIVNVIWYGESALSESDYLPDLRLVRWEANKVWSPWNCILLTKEEAVVHLRIASIHDVYDPNFIQKIRLKHYTTKSNFKMLLKSDVKINNDSLWQSIKDNGDLIDSRNINKYMERNRTDDDVAADLEDIKQRLTSREA